MAIPVEKVSSVEENDADRRRGILADDALSLDLVSAYAGDRLLTLMEKNFLAGLKKSRGLRFFSDLLYAITHQYFPPEEAEDLWIEIVCHKDKLSKALGRDVKIVVAVLDYLSNITESMDATTLVGEAYIEEVVGLSLRDGLTGLFNHSYFYQQIDLEVKRYARYGTAVSLVLIDIDDFKQVNDQFGHREGDRILATMAADLFKLARESDICCRYGGEEFAVILPLTGIHEASAIAQRMCTQMAQHLPGDKEVTVSIGVAACGQNISSFQDLFEKADDALYQIKKSGKKNRVFVHGNSESKLT